MEKEGNIYEDQTMESLLNLWVEAKQAGCKDRCDEIWNKLLLKDQLVTKTKLEELREELKSL